jgi:putative DNA primase/helicase
VGAWAHEGDALMDFIEFVRMHGIVIDDMPPMGRWVRLKTEDKPHKKNGSAKWLGDHGYCQNYATMPNVAVWKPDLADSAKPNIDHEAVRQSIERQERARAEGQQKAAKLAGWVLHQTRLSTHEYLARKGFPLEQGNVWTRTKEGITQKLLVIPMRVDGNVVGCQLIDEAGSKKFLTGQRTSNAVYVMDNHGRPVLCEGYATALSIRAALQAIRVRYRLIVCFSAGNLARIAETLPDAFLVADNDLSGTGQRIAGESGRPFFLPPIPGQDFNDWARDVGTFKASQALRSAMA